jgi:hypothetical protein
VTPFSCRVSRRACVVQPRFHGAVGDVQVVGDLGNREALVVGTANDGAVFGR